MSCFAQWQHMRFLSAGFLAVALAADGHPPL
jgi:hypothetical protein